MKGSLMKRIAVVEKEISSTCGIPAKDRLIILECPYGDEAEFDRLLAERKRELSEQYGPNISWDDFTVVEILKFSRAAKGDQADEKFEK